MHRIAGRAGESPVISSVPISIDGHTSSDCKRWTSVPLPPKFEAAFVNDGLRKGALLLHCRLRFPFLSIYISAAILPVSSHKLLCAEMCA